MANRLCDCSRQQDPRLARRRISTSSLVLVRSITGTTTRISSRLCCSTCKRMASYRAWICIQPLNETSSKLSIREFWPHAASTCASSFPGHPEPPPWKQRSGWPGKYTGRRPILSFDNAFHGMSLGALALSPRAAGEMAQLCPHTLVARYDDESAEVALSLEIGRGPRPSPTPSCRPPVSSRSSRVKADFIRHGTPG